MAGHGQNMMNLYLIVAKTIQTSLLIDF